VRVAGGFVMARRGSFSRETRETSVSATWDLDGTGKADVVTGIGMLDHFVSQIARHGIFDITLRAKGDIEVDTHHSVEDVGIALGRAFAEALGDARGIVRMGDALVPLDEALAQVAVDLSGRAYCVTAVSWSGQRIGELPSDLVEHFLQSIAYEAKFNLHARVYAGVNDHHKAECLMKALGRALCAATRIDERRAGQTPSTKEALG
jgi:imidazoleglycerol-phosphate dehydratase